MIASHNQPKVKRARASSARPSNEKARPQSGNSTKHVNKVDFIENMYGGLMTTKRHSNRNMPSKLGNGFGQDNEVSKLGYSKIFKQKQELLQENMQLKKQNHQLREELSHQKGKTEQMRKKNSEYTKKLSIEFQKQMYWSGTNTNMVRGIKSQYEAMKQKYQEKCREFDDMAKEFIYSQTRQDKVYIDALINQNEKLKRRIDQSYEELKHLQHGTLTSVVEESIQAYKAFKLQIQQENEVLSTELEQAKDKIKVLHRNLEQREKKIGFLDRLLIQRDNAEHAARRRLKKVEKEKQDLLDQFTEFKKQKGDLLDFYENKLKKAKDNYEKQSETQRIIFKNELLDKADRITKLEKEIAYLTTLLSYWKPLDQINEMVTNKIVTNTNNNNNNNFNNYNNSEYEKQFVLEYSMNSTLIKYNGSKHNIRVPSQQHEEQYQTKSIVSKSRKGSADQGYKNVSDVMTKSIDLNKGLGQKKKRTQITAEKRNTEEGVKSRKVDIAQVADICETIKYRFIGLNIPIQKVRKYFDYQDDMEMVTSEQEEAWKKEYINMREVKEILMNDDFGLNQNDAHMLSRFLVEDSQNEYVYCDPNNEHLRAVVKSIIKNIIGEYELPKNITAVTELANDYLYKYETNLESALKSTAPKGLISKKKILQLFKGLGIELTRELEDYFIGKIVIKSENLNNLRYKVMFQK